MDSNQCIFSIEKCEKDESEMIIENLRCHVEQLSSQLKIANDLIGELKAEIDVKHSCIVVLENSATRLNTEQTCIVNSLEAKLNAEYASSNCLRKELAQLKQQFEAEKVSFTSDKRCLEAEVNQFMTSTKRLEQERDNNAELVHQEQAERLALTVEREDLVRSYRRQLDEAANEISRLQAATDAKDHNLTDAKASLAQKRIEFDATLRVMCETAQQQEERTRLRIQDFEQRILELNEELQNERESAKKALSDANSVQSALREELRLCKENAKIAQEALHIELQSCNSLIKSLEQRAYMDKMVAVDQIEKLEAENCALNEGQEFLRSSLNTLANENATLSENLNLLKVDARSREEKLQGDVEIAKCECAQLHCKVDELIRANELDSSACQKSLESLVVQHSFILNQSEADCKSRLEAVETAAEKSALEHRLLLEEMEKSWKARLAAMEAVAQTEAEKLAREHSTALENIEQEWRRRLLAAEIEANCKSEQEQAGLTRQIQRQVCELKRLEQLIANVPDSVEVAARQRRLETELEDARLTADRASRQAKERHEDLLTQRQILAEEKKHWERRYKTLEQSLEHVEHDLSTSRRQLEVEQLRSSRLQEDLDQTQNESQRNTQDMIRQRQENARLRKYNNYYLSLSWERQASLKEAYEQLDLQQRRHSLQSSTTMTNLSHSMNMSQLGMTDISPIIGRRALRCTENLLPMATSTLLLRSPSTKKSNPVNTFHFSCEAEEDQMECKTLKTSNRGSANRTHQVGQKCASEKKTKLEQAKLNPATTARHNKTSSLLKKTHRPWPSSPPLSLASQVHISASTSATDETFSDSSQAQFQCQLREQDSLIQRQLLRY